MTHMAAPHAAAAEAGACRQDAQSVEKNSRFFADHHDGYNRRIQELDTYVRMRAHLNSALQGMGRLLDVGNGGVFDYDTQLARQIVAVDLFLDDAGAALPRPDNVELRRGDALALPCGAGEFDGVLMCMLLHHLIGKSAKESLSNVQSALGEAYRVLRPGGKLILMESCVPKWFYLFERAVFPVATRVIHWTLSHPATLQFPATLIGHRLEACGFVHVTRTAIPKGRWVLQYGFKFPSILTPASPYLWTVHKPG